MDVCVVLRVNTSGGAASHSTVGMFLLAEKDLRGG